MRDVYPWHEMKMNLNTWAWLAPTWPNFAKLPPNPPGFPPRNATRKTCVYIHPHSSGAEERPKPGPNWGTGSHPIILRLPPANCHSNLSHRPRRLMGGGGGVAGGGRRVKHAVYCKFYLLL